MSKIPVVPHFQSPPSSNICTLTFGFLPATWSGVSFAPLLQALSPAVMKGWNQIEFFFFNNGYKMNKYFKEKKKKKRFLGFPATIFSLLSHLLLETKKMNSKEANEVSMELTRNLSPPLSLWRKRKKKKDMNVPGLLLLPMWVISTSFFSAIVIADARPDPAVSTILVPLSHSQEAPISQFSSEMNVQSPGEVFSLSILWMLS